MFKIKKFSLVVFIISIILLLFSIYFVYTKQLPTNHKYFVTVKNTDENLAQVEKFKNKYEFTEESELIFILYNKSDFKIVQDSFISEDVENISYGGEMFSKYNTSNIIFIITFTLFLFISVSYFEIDFKKNILKNIGIVLVMLFTIFVSIGAYSFFSYLFFFSSMNFFILITLESILLLILWIKFIYFHSLNKAEYQTTTESLVGFFNILVKRGNIEVYVVLIVILILLGYLLYQFVAVLSVILLAFIYSFLSLFFAISLFEILENKFLKK